MTEITKEIAREKILNAGNDIFSVTFIKKDGSVRDMTCRLGVKKHLKGGKSTTAHIDHLITVFQMVSGISKGYRNVNIDTLSRVKINGETYEVKQ